MKRELIKSYIAVFILFLALLLIMVGMADGEVALILNKSINICMECIGIG